MTLGVLVTYFNERALLLECLNSVFGNKEVPDEVLVYDDASAYPAEDYISKDWPVRVIRGSSNHGLGFARNQLMEASGCEYVHYQDADDLFHPDWYRKVRALMERDRPDIILTEIQTFREERVLCDAVLGLETLAKIGDLVRFALLGSILPSASTFRRKVGLQIGGFRVREELPLSEDGDFHIRLAAASSKYEVILEPLILQRIRPESLSRNQGVQRLECYTSGLITLRSLSNKLHPRYRPDLADAAARLGSILFRAGDRSNARAGFQLAEELGGAHFTRQKPWYRAAARALGPERAEQIASIYRKTIPENVRAFVHRVHNASQRARMQGV